MAGKLNAVPFLRVAGFLMPYLTVAAGLYGFRSAWAAIVGYHLGILLILKFAGYAAPRRFEFTWQALLFGLVGLSAGLLLAVAWPYIHVAPSSTTK